jgi:hypothetical protein
LQDVAAVEFGLSVDRARVRRRLIRGERIFVAPEFLQNRPFIEKRAAIARPQRDDRLEASKRLFISAKAFEKAPRLVRASQ